VVRAGKIQVGFGRVRKPPDSKKKSQHLRKDRPPCGNLNRKKVKGTVRTVDRKKRLVDNADSPPLCDGTLKEDTGEEP